MKVKVYAIVQYHLLTDKRSLIALYGDNNLNRAKIQVDKLNHNLSKIFKQSELMRDFELFYQGLYELEEHKSKNN